MGICHHEPKRHHEERREEHHEARREEHHEP